MCRAVELDGSGSRLGRLDVSRPAGDSQFVVVQAELVHRFLAGEAARDRIANHWVSDTIKPLNFGQAFADRLKYTVGWMGQTGC
jgi:hypothetical protein